MASRAKRAPTSATRADAHVAGHWLDDHGRNLAGVGLEQNKSRRRDLDGEAKQRRQEQQAGESRNLERIADVDSNEQERERGGNVDRDQQIEQERGQRNNHGSDDKRDHSRKHQVGVVRKQGAHVARTQQGQKTTSHPLHPSRHRARIFSRARRHVKCIRAFSVLARATR